MLTFTCVSCMFVANTTLFIVFLMSGDFVLGSLSLFGAFVTASGVYKALHETPAEQPDDPR